MRINTNSFYQPIKPHFTNQDMQTLIDGLIRKEDGSFDLGATISSIGEKAYETVAVPLSEAANYLFPEKKQLLSDEEYSYRFAKAAGLLQDKVEEDQGSKDEPYDEKLLNIDMVSEFDDFESAKTTLSEFSSIFYPIIGKLDKEKHLTPAERDKLKGMTRDYYNYLKSNNIAYGHIAYDASQNTGFSGKAANNYLDSAMRSEHPEWSANKRSEVRDEIMFRLAYYDSQSRHKALTESGVVTTKKISDYHYDALEKATLSKEAWGGALLQEFSGDGHWMFNYKEGIDVQQAAIIKAIVEDKKINGVSARKVAKYMMGIAPEEIRFLSPDIHPNTIASLLNKNDNVLDNNKLLMGMEFNDLY